MMIPFASAHTVGEEATLVTNDQVPAEEQLTSPHPLIVGFILVPSALLTMCMLVLIVWAWAQGTRRKP